jgi:8-oxo-dGTP pyrophosphatase MutT (NUDIX family)
MADTERTEGEPAPGYPQIIPRPERWEPGAPAPWAALTGGERRGIGIERVLAALSARGLLGPPPGTLYADPGGWVADGNPPKAPRTESSVLVALFEEDGEARVVLTRRASHLRTHRGEVSFPGGRLDPGEDAVDAALREAEEEVGMEPAAVEVVGHMRPIYTMVSGAQIQPVVGLLRARPELAAAPAEVERVFDVALADLLVEGVFHEERWHRLELFDPRGEGFSLCFFEVAGEMIWGATGRLLVDLVTTVLGLEQPGYI